MQAEIAPGRRLGSDGGESMAASFVTNQKYGRIGFPANTERNQQIHHLAHGHLLLRGHLGTGKNHQHLTGTLNLVGNPTVASNLNPHSCSSVELIIFSSFCPPQTCVSPAKAGSRGGLGRIVGFPTGKFKTVVLFQSSSISNNPWLFLWDGIFAGSSVDL